MDLSNYTLEDWIDICGITPMCDCDDGKCLMHEMCKVADVITEPRTWELASDHDIFLDELVSYCKGKTICTGCEHGGCCIDMGEPPDLWEFPDGGGPDAD